MNDDGIKKIITALIKSTIEDIDKITDNKDKAMAKTELIKALVEVSEKIN